MEEKPVGGDISPVNVSTDFFQLGLDFLDVGSHEILELGEFIHQLYLEVGCISKGKKPNNDAHRHLKGAVFALGSIAKNPEWKEHSGSSLREILYVWGKGSIDLHKCLVAVFKSNNGDKIKDEQVVFLKEQAKVLLDFYKYFSATVHHDPNGITHGYRALTGDFKKNYQECVTDDEIKKMISIYFSKFYSIKNYCIK
jgi:hypothetical protein